MALVVGSLPVVACAGWIALGTVKHFRYRATCKARLRRAVV
jgi:hypothetical protein